MDNNTAVWLPHLTNEIVADARGPEFDAYLVALEGWRRGLTLKWHTKDSEKFPEMKTWFVERPGKLFSLRSEEKTHYFFRTRGDKVTNEAVQLGADKEETKQLLTKAGIRVPKGKQFGSDINNEEIIKYALTIGYPVVLKPTNGSFGRGVVTNIQNDESLQRALKYVRHELNYPDVILEQHIQGKEYRIYVVGNKVVAAINRIPANVIGDGESTVKALVDKKNEERKKNPRLISCLIRLDREMENFLQSNGTSINYVPKEGERIFLTSKSNISIGGDPVDVLDELPQEVKQVAVEALQTVPGLYHGAVDLILETETSPESAVVILELNPTSQIGSLLFPVKGKARDVPAAIIDYYFPETADIITDKEKVYFDFTDILEPLITKVATVSTVSQAPVGKIYSKKYTVTGQVQGIDYHRGLRKQAFERKLSGYVSNLENGAIDVIVTGINKDSVDQFREAILADPERSEVLDIEEEEWFGPVKVGFQVKADLKTQVEQLKELQWDLELKERELKQIKQRYKNYKNSLAWRITYPFRKIMDIIKLIVR